MPDQPEYQIDGSKLYQVTITTNRGVMVLELRNPPANTYRPMRNWWQPTTRFRSAW